LLIIEMAQGAVELETLMRLFLPVHRQPFGDSSGMQIIMQVFTVTEQQCQLLSLL
jgi:hypothetical protein